MTVRELVNSFPTLKEISFIKDNCEIETINCFANGSFRAAQKHYDETVYRVFAIGEDRIRIGSK